jgi:NAD(P)-dependent dehydrogenase (short-subunit alcohol dehydrogenase family)
LTAIDQGQMSDRQEYSVKQAFDLTGRVVVITGGAGLLGFRHGEAVAEQGGVPVLVDIDTARAEAAATAIAKKFKVQTLGLGADITEASQVQRLRDEVLQRFDRVDAIINNAANNPKVEGYGLARGHWSRLENLPLDVWQKDIAVGLTGAFLCSRAFGPEMARAGKGVILNVASDLGLIGPDQRIYRRAGESAEDQMVKPVSYSVVKAGIIGLTRYLATYWIGRNVRANALAPGGVQADQDQAFIARLTNLIPLGRMADQNEYKAAVVFLISDASSYMNGAVISMDGGRTTW